MLMCRVLPGLVPEHLLFALTNAVMVLVRQKMPLAKKTTMAHYVIDGTLSFEQTKHEVQRIYAELKQLA